MWYDTCTCICYIFTLGGLTQIDIHVSQGVGHLIGFDTIQCQTCLQGSGFHLTNALIHDLD